MADRKIKTARNIAVAVLNRFDSTGDYVRTVLDKLLVQTEQKQQATDIVFGCMRNRGAINMIITKLADCPVERIPSNVLSVIRVGAYELIYSPETAEYAVVNEAVENAKAVAGKKQVAFVNAVLRQIARHIKNRQARLSEINVQKTLPQTLSTGCEFDADILPNPEDSPADFLSNAFSLPKWLINDWLNEYGKELARQICFASNRKPGIYIRPNILKTTTAELAEKLRVADIEVEIVTDSEMIMVQSPWAITELPGFADGLFSVQDISAARLLRLLQPKPQWTILDLCAAPGTKTTQLAEMTADKAKIVATDIDGDRLEKVKENIARLGIKSVTVIKYEKLFKNSRFSQFDAVLLDVPCSNTGVLAKRVEARYKIKPKAIQELAEVQNGLLKTAASMIKPQGKICYSTCSIQNYENSGLVKEFLRKNPALELKAEQLTLPSAQNFDHDGGYAAIVAGK